MAKIPEGMTIQDVERHLVCAVLIDREVRTRLRRVFKPEAFSVELHAAVYRAVLECEDREWLVTNRNIARLSSCKPSTIGDLARVDVAAEHTIPADYAATVVTEDAALRYFIGRGETQVEMARSARGGDGEILGVLRYAASTVDAMRRYEASRAEALNAREFASSVDTSQRWLIPGLLERADRMLIVAAEGSGKSFLLRQWAVMAAAGAHWATAGHCAPRRVLIVDCENSKAQVARELRPLFDRADRYGRSWNERLTIHVAPQGLDLLGRMRDVRLVEGLLESTQAELLVIGPLYRLAGDASEGWEKHARDLQSVFDGWRDAFGVALAIEHHSGHSKDDTGRRAVRPMGSAGWLRWPEIGLALAWNEADRQFSVGRFRGDRGGRRAFPPVLEHAGEREDEWPWVANWEKFEPQRSQLVALIDQERAFAAQLGAPVEDEIF